MGYMASILVGLFSREFIGCTPNSVGPMLFIVFSRDSWGLYISPINPNYIGLVFGWISHRGTLVGVHPTTVSPDRGKSSSSSVKNTHQQWESRLGSWPGVRVCLFT